MEESKRKEIRENVSRKINAPYLLENYYSVPVDQIQVATIEPFEKEIEELTQARDALQKDKDYLIEQVNKLQLIAEKRNWPEDYEQENGSYFNVCVYCENQFIGYKRRVVCKSCDILMTTECNFTIDTIIDHFKGLLLDYPEDHDDDTRGPSRVCWENAIEKLEELKK